MTRKYIYYTLIVVLSLASCSKEKAIESFEFSKIRVHSKAYVGTPVVEIYINNVLIGEVPPNEDLSKPVAVSNEPVTMTVKDPATGEVLLDSVFVPKINNDFTILIDNDLGIRQFYTETGEEPRPVSADSFRVQLFHKIEYQNIKRTVVFKVFEDMSGSASSVDLYELPIQITVPYGHISGDLNIPYEKKPNGRYKKYRLKAYDAATGALLVDIVPPYPGALTIAGGQYYLFNMKVAEDPNAETGLTWNYTSTDKYEPLL